MDMFFKNSCKRTVQDKIMKTRYKIGDKVKIKSKNGMMKTKTVLEMFVYAIGYLMKDVKNIAD